MIKHNARVEGEKISKSGIYSRIFIIPLSSNMSEENGAVSFR